WIPNQIGENSDFHAVGTLDVPGLAGIEEDVLHVEVAIAAVVGRGGIPGHHAHAGLHVDRLHRERIGHLEIGSIGAFSFVVPVGGAEQNRVPRQREGQFFRYDPARAYLDAVGGMAVEYEIAV